MSVFKSQFAHALSVIKSDKAIVPYPQVITTRVNTAVVVNQLVDATAAFITKGIAPGDVVYNTTTKAAATVVSVTSETMLTMNGDIFSATGNTYIVYAASPQTGFGTQGCMIYVCGDGSPAYVADVDVITIGGENVLFTAVPAGSLLPVQVVQVTTKTAATNLIALW
jgi:hypothetical protein